jgi:hypothetical protein
MSDKIAECYKQIRESVDSGRLKFTKPKMQKLGSTFGDLVKLKRQEVDAKESRETDTRS